MGMTHIAVGTAIGADQDDLSQHMASTPGDYLGHSSEIPHSSDMTRGGATQNPIPAAAPCPPEEGRGVRPLQK